MSSAMDAESGERPVEEEVEEKKQSKEDSELETKEKTDEESKETEKEEGAAMEVDQAPKKRVEPYEEIEQDAPLDSRMKLSANAVSIGHSDCTLNVMPVFGGKLLTSFTDSGFSYLVACARSNVGIKAGRYFFEATIIELWNAPSPHGKSVVRLGLTLGRSSLFFDDSKDNFYYQPRILKGPRVAVLANLDSSSSNYHTLSFFVNGVRQGMPQKLPESWKGKALFPTVNYRGVTLEVNFGPTVKCALPFACRTLADAAEADVEVVKVLPNGGKYDVVFPVCLPEHGAFDWADNFLAKNPSYTEISARMIKDWAFKSGLPAVRTKWDYNDTPNQNFNIPEFVDSLVVRMAKTLAADYHQRNLLIMELKSNLLPEERMANLGKFSHCKKTAVVLMGDPSDEYKKVVQDIILAEKVLKHNFERRRKGALVSTETEEPVVLTEEEKAIVFRTGQRDLNPDLVSRIFAKFALPSQEEGFDAIEYLWEDEAGSKKALHEYIAGLKGTAKVEDIKPGEWFNKQWKELFLLTQQWRKRSNEWKNPISRKKILNKKLEEKREAAKKEAEAAAAVADVKLPEIDLDEVDPFSVEDVTDLGSGEPLFSKWAAEDWILLTLRIQMYLLIHAFVKDVKDPDRPSFPAPHTFFYYHKYFKQTLNIKNYDCNSFADFVELLEESIKLNDANMLESVLKVDTPHNHFVKLVEWHRRDRQRRLDAGDETADVKFESLKGPGNFGSGPSMPPPQPSGPPSSGVKRPMSYSDGAFAASKQIRLSDQGMAMAAARQAGMLQGSVFPQIPGGYAP